jgi:G3E family GTPase
VKQVALADTVVVTKTDLAGAAAAAALTSRLLTINPALTVVAARHGAIAPDAVLGNAAAVPRAASQIEPWLRFEAFADRRGGDSAHTHGHDGPGRHGEGVRSLAVTLDDPVRWRDLEAWLNSVLSLRGADMLRVKGILNVAGQPGPVILHAVQHLLHPLSRLESWPDADRRSRIVCIARDIPTAALAASLRIGLAGDGGEGRAGDVPDRAPAGLD